MESYISLTESSRQLCPARVVTNMIERINEISGNPPFVIISSVTKNYGRNVMPTGWHNLFKPDQKAKTLHIYEMCVNSIEEIEVRLEETSNIVAVINRNPVTMTPPIEMMRTNLPLMLIENMKFLPYDPANGMELQSILNMAIEQHGSNGKVAYLSAHDFKSSLPKSAESVSESDIIKGMYLYKSGSRGRADVRILGGGAALEKAYYAALHLESMLGIGAEVWSCPSYTMMAREIEENENKSLLDPDALLGQTHIEECFKNTSIPTIAITSYNSLICEQIAKGVKGRMYSLGLYQNMNMSTTSSPLEMRDIVHRCAYYMYKEGLISEFSFKK